MKSSKYFSLITSAIAAAALSVAGFAQTSTPTTTTTTPTATTTTPVKKPAGVDKRHSYQQKRIGEGLENGSLTAGEAKQIENKETKINKEEAKMRKADDGKLTAADKAKLEKQENTVSKDIYAQKHDAQHQQMKGGEIAQRKRNEQKRIGEGLENGNVTAGEAKRLETQQQGINKTEAGMREADGGKLTKADRKTLNQEQNQASKNIYTKKHNGRRR
jgi:hypothetical protein